MQSIARIFCEKRAEEKKGPQRLAFGFLHPGRVFRVSKYVVQPCSDYLEVLIQGHPHRQVVLSRLWHRPSSTRGVLGCLG